MSKTVELQGFTIPRRSAAIHFYYGEADRRRFAHFLMDGVARRESVVLACTIGGHEVFRGALREAGLTLPVSELLRVEVTSDLRSTLGNIQEAFRFGQRRNSYGRLLADFDSLVGEESLFELEALLSQVLAGNEITCLSQYDGKCFRAPITIEQFQTHALCVVGNAFYHLNRDYTPPSRYLRQKAGAR